MNQETIARIRAYAESCREEQRELLRQLGRIPAPSHQEDRRAAFCLDWLKRQGAEDVTIDPAKNVICALGCDEKKDLVVFAAHTDIVFPDLEELPMEEREGRLYAPGIGDDTANLVNLLLAARYLIQNRPALGCGVLIVANSCEEGLGNLKGTRALFDAYGSRIRAYCSLDMHMPFCCRSAVGSYRYKITCRTEGGHSYADFGKPSAIRLLCGLADALYRIDPPPATSYNIGRIEGGTTVNSIAQQAYMLYEFRSESQDALAWMEHAFRDTLSRWEGLGGSFEVELLGVRPGSGTVDPAALDRLSRCTGEVVRTFSGQEPEWSAASTDSNIPLSLGIPANTVGTVRGALCHTRQEWVELDSLPEGLCIALGLVLELGGLFGS